MITLVIIGVVAAITMPMMVADWHKKATTAKLKKFHSTMLNVFRHTVVDNGDWYAWEYDDDQKKFAETYFLPYLNVGQICEYGKDDVCNYTYTKSIYGKKYSYDFYSFQNANTLALADGSTLCFYVLVGSSGGYHKITHLSFVFDTNGPKKPNIEGKDIFSFSVYPNDNGYLYFYDKSNLPGNAPKTRENYKSACKKTGSAYCTLLMMKDGWELRDDYPG